MDWDAAHARDVAQALAEHYGFPFAERHLPKSNGATFAVAHSWS